MQKLCIRLRRWFLISLSTSGGSYFRHAVEEKKRRQNPLGRINKNALAPPETVSRDYRFRPQLHHGQLDDLGVLVDERLEIGAKKSRPNREITGQFHELIGAVEAHASVRSHAGNVAAVDRGAVREHAKVLPVEHVRDGDLSPVDAVDDDRGRSG